MVDVINTILDILLPRRCPLCGKVVYGRETFICAKCLLQLPIVAIPDIYDNTLTRTFWHLLPIEKGWYMMHYTAHNPLILSPKFKHDIYTAMGVGRLLATYVPEDYFDDIDIIIPMPSTSKHIKRRQMNHIVVEAESMVKARGLDTPIATDIAERVSSQRSQIGLDIFERQQNVSATDFNIKHCERLNGKHILLMDDVMTTGSTLLALATVIMRHCHDVRFSIIVVAKAGDKH